MLRFFILLGTALVASGSYTYTRPGTTPVQPGNSRIAPSVLPPPPASFIPNDFSHNISFVISAKNLPSKTLDTIDPYFKVYETSKTIIEPTKFGQTEVIDNEPNPEFATVIWFNWKKGSNQTLIFKLKDSDRIRDNDIDKVNLEADTFALKGFKVNLSLSNGGSILIQKTQPIRFMLYARGLPHKDPFNGKSDPYVECYWRRGAKGQERKFFTTSVLNDLENADWPEIIEFPNYIKGQDLYLVFRVYDSDGVKSEDLGETILELDPYVEKRQTKIMRLGKQGESQLGVTPV